MNEDVQILVSRAVLQFFATAVQQLDPEQSTWIGSTLVHSLDKIRPRVVSFEEADAGLRTFGIDLDWDGRLHRSGESAGLGQY